MGAGDGAAEQARLARERAARLRRELDQAERAERAWAAGAAGEARVATVLDSLEDHGWLALHDVHWPGRPKANLDHVLIGPGGVVVIDAKNWSGNVLLRQGVLRQNGYSREREAASVLEQSAAVAALLEPQDRRYVQAWLCMVGQPTLRGVTTSGVRFEGIDTVRDAIIAAPPVLEANAATAIHHYLTQLLTGSSSPPQLTTRHSQNWTVDFAQGAGPAASLAQWRSTRDPADDPRTVRPLRPAKPRAKRRKRPSCLGVLFRLALIIFALGVILNALSHLAPHPSKTPAPRPAVTTTVSAPP